MRVPVERDRDFRSKATHDICAWNQLTSREDGRLGLDHAPLRDRLVGFLRTQAGCGRCCRNERDPEAGRHSQAHNEERAH